MIQTLNSTQYNPTKPSVSLLHSVFLSSLHSFTLTVALFSHHCTLYAFSRLSSIFCFLYVYMRKESINIVAEKERVVDGGEGG
jgi:hypothetical protein